eukprot:13929949-Alexandrium_andersonii.AAC.1
MSLALGPGECPALAFSRERCARWRSAGTDECCAHKGPAALRAQCTNADVCTAPENAGHQH